MKKRGFTLIELLAVIVIMGILAALIVPNVLKSMDNYRDKEYDSLVVMIESGGNLYGSRHEEEVDEALNTVGYFSLTLQQLIDNKLLTGPLVDPRTNQEISLNKKVYLYEQNNRTVACFEDACKDLTFIYYDSIKGVNRPLLASGMTPIKWDGSAWVDTTIDDLDWYSYTETNKKWANARTDDGSMWVWIPRYVYKITSGWHSNTTGTIEIKFSKNTDDTIDQTLVLDTRTLAEASNATTNGNKYTNHPAFKFGSIELTGIWVAKFEATAAEGVANGYTSDSSCPTTGDNVITKTIKIVPNVQSWRCIQIGNAFTVLRNMEQNNIYGWGTTGSGIDTHLMKNIEWGAIAYLSKSIYGQNTNKIWVNPANNYTTGCAGTTGTSSSTIGCTNTYDSAYGVNASTTGNIYGIYDLSGGSRELVSAYVNNGISNLNTYGSSIINATSQYKDIYTKGSTDDQAPNYQLTINSKGDALYETSSSISGAYAWFNESTYMPSTYYPWFSRDAYFASGSLTGVFAFSMAYGSNSSEHGFRPVLLVQSGL